MFKVPQFLSIFTAYFFCVFCSFGQIQKDPTTWNYSAIKTGNNTYELRFDLQLNEGWHIWSLNPLGDGYLLPPTVTLDKSPAFRATGKLQEKGKRIVEQVGGSDKPVAYLKQSVSYSLKINAAPKTVVSGTHRYQVCKDNLCLAPKDKQFSITLP